MEEKVYKTYRQLITKLRNRGMDIPKGSQGSRVIRILEHENYYNVINGYKELFLLRRASSSNDEQYKDGTTFDEVYALYNFDRNLRNIYLKYLLKIENEFKTVIAHEFSAKYGYDNYLKLENFHFSATNNDRELRSIAKKNKLDYSKDILKIKRISAENNAASVIKLIGDIQQEIARQISKHHQVVTHYLTQHGYIPLWVLVNVLTFGKITAFYYNMKPDDRETVARKFSIPEWELYKYMQMLGLARNRCAHDERFFDMRFKQRLHTKSIKNFSLLNLETDDSGSYPNGTNDIYAIAIIFAMLLRKSDIREFVSSMKSLFLKLQKELHTISIDDVMKKMGFSENWTNLQNLK